MEASKEQLQARNQNNKIRQLDVEVVEFEGEGLQERRSGGWGTITKDAW